MTLCTKLEDEEDNEEEEQENYPKGDSLQMHIGWRQIHLPKEMDQHVAIALHHPEFYANKLKGIRKCCGKYSNFKIYKPQVQGVSLGTWGVVRRELCSNHQN